MPVKHAEHMMQYAKDAATNDKPWELWEYRRESWSGWIALEKNPIWNPDYEYRRKPSKIQLPKCVLSSEEMSYGRTYYVPSLEANSKFHQINWYNDDTDSRFLKRGLIFLKSEDAIEYVEILLSLRNYEIVQKS